MYKKDTQTSHRVTSKSTHDNSICRKFQRNKAVLRNAGGCTAHDGSGKVGQQESDHGRGRPDWRIEDTPEALMALVGSGVRLRGTTHRGLPRAVF